MNPMRQSDEDEGYGVQPKIGMKALTLGDYPFFMQRETSKGIKKFSTLFVIWVEPLVTKLLGFEFYGLSFIFSAYKYVFVI